MYYYIKRRSKEKGVRYVKGIGSRLRENIMFSFDDVLDSVKEEQRLNTTQLTDELMKESKEYLIKKILKLQEKLKTNKELSESISNAIADGFNKAINDYAEEANYIKKGGKIDPEDIKEDVTNLYDSLINNLDDILRDYA